MKSFWWIVLCILPCFSCRTSAQTALGWPNVQRLSADQLIRIRSFQQVAICNFSSADNDELLCRQTRTIFFVPIHSALHFRRTDVQSVKISRHAASTLLGATIGIGTGAGIGAGIDASAKNQVEDGHLLTVLMSLLGGLIGTGIGSHTDFVAGPVIYQAP
jgi:hypothetical protein